MDPLLATLILILFAFLGARFSFSAESVPAGPRLLFRTGTHFIFVGFVLGPSAMEFVTEDALEHLFPFLALGLGWVGLLFGLQFERDTLRAFPLRLHLFSAGQALLTFAMFSGAGLAVLFSLGMVGSSEVLLVLSAAATACISAPAGIAIISSNFLVRGPVREMLLFVASMDAVIGIAILQVVYSTYHVADTSVLLGTVPAPLWTLLAIGIGVLCGIIFVWLTRIRTEVEELVLFLMGITAFTAGAALQLQLSPLFVCLVTGVVVGNLVPDPRRVYRIMAKWEKPVYVVFLMLAGALLDFPSLWILPLAFGYAILRAGAKIVACGAMVRIAHPGFDIPRLLGLGLIPQGGVSLAMALSAYLTFYELEVEGVDAGQTLFSVVVLGVVLSELVGPVFTTRTLRRAGEISSRVEEALSERDDQLARTQAARHTPGADLDSDLEL
jgi:hypothetical protein